MFTHTVTKLPAQDLERAREWYREKLGLEAAEEREGGLRYVVGPTEFHVFQTAGDAPKESTQMGFEVDDFDGVVNTLQARGVSFDEFGMAEVEGNYPSKGTGERGTWFRDSEGNLIGIGQAVR